jgi:colanic acid biosynthesis protein WcaH
MKPTGWLTDEQMKAQVRDGLLVSIDLLIRNGRGKWLLALRKNRPAHSSWFVPGGRIHKGERIPEAFERLVKFEFDIELTYQRSQFVGVFVHYYDDNRWNEPGFGTHYLVLAHLVEVGSDWQDVVNSETALEQHHEVRWFDPKAALADPKVHPYTKQYLRGMTGFPGVVECFPTND